MPPAVLRAYLLARRLPERLLAMVVLAVGGFGLGHLPTPSLRVDLEAVAYPAVLVGALVPVLVGVVAAYPVPERLTWLTAPARGRPRLLGLVESALVLAGAAGAGALSAVTASLAAAGAQNALMVAGVAAVLAIVLGAGPACVLVGAGGLVSLLTVPDVGIVDRTPDAADWVLVALLLPLALAARRG